MRRQGGQAAPPAQPRYSQPLGFVSSGVVDPYQVDTAVITPALRPAPDLAARPPSAMTDAPGSSSSGGGASLATPASTEHGMLADAVARDWDVERQMGELVLRGSAQEAAQMGLLAEADLAEDMGRAGLGCSGQQEQQRMAAEGCIQYTVLEGMQLGSSTPGAMQPMDVCQAFPTEPGGTALSQSHATDL